MATAWSGCTDASNADRYFLTGDDIPRGLEICRPGPEMRAEGFSKNPDRLPAEALEEFEEEDAEGRPERGWMQLLTSDDVDTCEGSEDGGVIIMVIEWSSAKALAQNVEDLGEECEDVENVYYEDRFIVAVQGFDEEDIERVAEAVTDKNPGLEPFC